MVTKGTFSRVVSVEKLSPTVLSIKFEPSIRFSFAAGQLVTLAIPRIGLAPLTRSFSLANSFEEALQGGYQILVKLIPGGMASEFLKRIQVGDRLLVSGPYGDLRLWLPLEGRQLCFITTSTGIAPVRAMVASRLFSTHKPKTLILSGVRDESEKIIPHYFEAKGIEVIHCVSRPKNLTKGFWGRVTDFIIHRGESIAWDKTDFYVIGNPRMVEAVNFLLQTRYNVLAENIYLQNRVTSVSRSNNVLSLLDYTQTLPRKKAA